MKKLIAFFLCAVMLLTCLAGCGEKKTDETPIIGVCMQNKSSSIAVLQEKALIELFEPLGYDVQTVSADDSSATQRSQVENFILMGAEMLVILPCELSVLEDSLIKAREQGIKVVVSGGTDMVSEDAFDAVSSDDEFMVGMYVASVAKTWIEAHMDPNGDWDVHFLTSTLSDDAIDRCKGEAMIIEPWLKNVKGEYVNLMGQVVSEADRIENPVYCKMVADRVDNYDTHNTQMSMTDNRGVVSGVLTQNDKVRIFIAYNSLASTAGSTLITDNYSDIADEFAFFSAGVMGDEYEFLIGSVSGEAGTKSVFRAACQFGGGDAAATLANLCNKVMFGQAGVDYGKSNPNAIGLWYPIDGEINNGVDALVWFDSPSYISAFTYEEVLAQEGLKTYWDSVNGYNESMQETPGQTDNEEPSAGGELEGGTAYTTVWQGLGEETHEIDLMDDGTCKFFLPGNAMITDVYAGTYTIADDGVTVTITGLTNVDASSAYAIPGLWSYIDAATGDATIIIDPASGTYTPVVEGGDEPVGPAEPDEPVEDPAPVGTGSYTYEFEGMMGTETAQFDLAEDGTCQFYLPGNPMIKDVYAGTYTRSGNVVEIVGLTNMDTASAYTTPGLWDWIVDGNTTITVNDADSTFVPGAEESAGFAAGSYTYEFEGMMGTETAQFDLAEDGTCQFYLPGNPMIKDVYAGTYTVDGNTVTITGLTNVDTSSAYTIPGLWNWIVDGNAVITVDAAVGTFTPVE